MVIQVQILDKNVFMSPRNNILGKVMYPSILASSYVKIVGQIGFLRLGKVTSLGKRKNSEIKPAVTLLKNDLVSHRARDSDGSGVR